MDTLIVEDVRCFAGRHEIPIRPITLLIGENSTGKSTFLAMVRLVWDLFKANQVPDFNEEPFVLGAFKEIATYRGGRGGRAKSFCIGANVSTSRGRTPISLLAVFENIDGQPALSSVELKQQNVRVSVTYRGSAGRAQFRVESKSGVISLPPLPYHRGDFVRPELILSFARVLRLNKDLAQAAQIQGPTPTAAELEQFRKEWERVLKALGPRPHAFAPIRSRPKRTYDPVRDAPEPEGSHVPMILAKLSTSDPERWRALNRVLADFGEKSGLFSSLDIRRFRGPGPGPFQIRVKISGPAFNLADVGYGVSQVLPMLVEMVQGQRGSTYLLQQPEVHLHPKAQAAMGSLLAVIAKEDRKRFLVETHSDYLVDRVRMEVREGRLIQSDVSLLYFERENGTVKVHELELDAYGNISNPPPGYRQFFLQEQRRLLGV